MMRHPLHALTGTARALHRLYILFHTAMNLLLRILPESLIPPGYGMGMWVRATADQVTGGVPRHLAGSWGSSDPVGEKFCSAANILTKRGCWMSCCPCT